MPKKAEAKPAKEEEIVLGIDYGDKNIGIAFGRNGYASPLKILPGTPTMDAVHELTRLAIENKISKFVVGLPLTAEGKETKQSIIIRKFAKMLKIVSKKPLVFINEYDTSKEAQAEKAYFGVSAKRAALSDHVSAAIILKRYFGDEVTFS